MVAEVYTLHISFKNIVATIEVTHDLKDRIEKYLDK